MKDIFVKKYWEEEDVLFYLHFHNNRAVRQIEIASEGAVFMDLDAPFCNGAMLYDKPLDELNLKKSDFITEKDFNSVWNK
jgi:hypothetical protein